MGDSQSETRFAKCSCQHCGGHIEFDASYSGMSVKCPHCFETTALLAQEIPTQEPMPIPFTPTKKKILSERELNKAWNKYNKFKARFDLDVNKTKGARISLTSSQMQLPSVMELLNLLTDITKNGLVNDAGANRLQDWLDANPNSEIPAIGYLSCIARLVLAEGELCPKNYPEFLIVLELQKAIERVLPKKNRDLVIEKRQIIEAQIREELPEAKASESQLDYIRGLGGNASPDLTISEAHCLIDQLLEKTPNPTEIPATEKQTEFIRALVLELGGNPPLKFDLTKAEAQIGIEELLKRRHALQSSQQEPTPRQLMTLRFWNRSDLTRKSKWDVEQWMDGFYGEDPQRKAAWELFKKEIGDDGTFSNPELVLIGAGEQYLLKIREEKFRSGSTL